MRILPAIYLAGVLMLAGAIFAAGARSTRLEWRAADA
jgi:hypothetical protein